MLHRAKKGCKKNEVTISLDEFEVLSNLSNFKNLAAMIEAEASMRHKKIKRRKKNKKIGFEAQDERTVCTRDIFLFSDFIWLWEKEWGKERRRVSGQSKSSPFFLSFPSLCDHHLIAFMGLFDSHFK